MIGIDDAVTAASTLITSAMNKIWPDPAQQATAEALLLKTNAEAAINTMATSMEVLLAVAKSEHWIAACWRPVVMLTFTGLIVARWCGLSAPGISEAEMLKLWDIVQFGLGGYVVSRSAEKIVPQVAGAIAAAMPARQAPAAAVRASVGSQVGNG